MGIVESPKYFPHVPQLKVLRSDFELALVVDPTIKLGQMVFDQVGSVGLKLIHFAVY